jgi:type VII secretion-associated serine protease mycosin
MPSPLRRLPVALLVLPLGLAGCAVEAGSPLTSASVAPSAASPTIAPTAAQARWDRPTPSTQAAPAEVVAAAPVRGAVRVVTVRSVAGRPQVDVATVDGRAEAAQAVAGSQRVPGVVSVGVDTQVRATAVRSDDTYRTSQWGLDRLHAEDVWAQRTGAPPVTVAVVDSGVTGGHPDLAGAVLPGTDFVTAGGDGTADANGHGTHVAGIIGAVAGNHLGVAGLASGVKILPVRVLDARGSGWNSAIAKGIVYAADHGAAVVNLSLGGPSADSATADAVRYALARNVVVTAAAGNERSSGSPTSYPAAYSGVLGVAATDSIDRVASFSNAGSYVDVAAPGARILSTVKPDAYAYMSGTSMATPFVAAAAGILKAADPSLTPARVADLLQSTATDLGPAGRDDDFGYGLINPYAALCAVTGCGQSPTPSPSAPSPSAPAPNPSTPASSSPTPPPRAATVTTMVSRSATVRHGATVVATARVLNSAGASGLSRVPVQLCVKAAPAGSYGCRTYTADSRGYASHRFTATATTEVYAVHVGTATTAPSASAVIRYTVAPTVRLSTHRQTVTVRLNPATGQRVELQRWNGSTWTTDTTATVDSGGAVTFRELARTYYRVHVAAGPALAGTTSGYVRIR